MTGHRIAPKFLPVVLGVCLGALWAVPLHAAPSSAQVRAIRVSESAGDTAITIAASARPTFTTWKLEQPARVVVDVSGARLGDVDVPLDAGTYAVGMVSANVSEDEASGPHTRIVLTLRQASDYQVEAHGNDIVVRVQPHVRPTLASDKSSAAQAEADKLKKQLDDARQEAEKARAAASAAAADLERHRNEVARLEAQTRGAAGASESHKAEAEKLKKQLDEARREAEKARAAASATAAEAERRREALARSDAEAKKSQKEAEQARQRAEAAERQSREALARSDAEAKKSQKEAEQARQRAEAAERQSREALARSDAQAKKSQKEAEQARQRAEAAERQTRETLARSDAEAKKAQKEAEQARQRAEAAERQARETLARSDAEAKKAHKEAEQARQRAEAAERQTREALARSDAEAKKSQKEAEEARRRAEAAERQTREAQTREAERSRALAVAAREIESRDQALQANARSQEEQRQRLGEAQRLVREREVEFASKDKVRAAEEEQRLAEARAARAKLEDERRQLEAERAQLQKTRDALAAEVERLKTTAKAPAQAPERAKPASLAQAAAPRTEVLRVVAPPAEPQSSRPRSITLRVPSQIQRVDFVDEPTRSSVIIDLNEPSDFAVERAAGTRLSLRFDHAELPQTLERNLDATEYLGPVRLISTYRDPRQRGAVRVDVDLAENVPSRVRREGTRIFWDFQKVPEKSPSLPALQFPLPKVQMLRAPRVAAFAVNLAQVPVVAQSQTLNRKGAPDPATAAGIRPTKKRYVGRRIDLDFKGADIHNILRLLSDVGQINIVTSDEVRGEVTIKMRDVPWDQAMDVVLRAKGLGSVREGNLLRVAPLSVLEKELEEEIHRQKSMQEVLPTETRLIGVSYASAGSLQEKAKDLLSPRGKISVDERTNNLIVSDVARNLQLVEDLVRNLDTQTAQVVIEARIVEARSTFVRQMGIQWGGNAFMDSAHGNPTGLSFPYNVGIGGGADDTAASSNGLVPYPRTGVPASTNPNFLVNMPVAAGQGTGSAIGLTLGSVAGAFNLNLRLSANESTGQIRILSSPRITTMDNIHANITQGVSIPVSVVSAMGAQTQFVDAKLDLGVRPHVTNEGTITLDLSVTRNEPDFSNTGARGDPTILKKEAKTTMLVRDGDTAVIGGIYTRNSGLSNAKVPFFADIPVLGWFFRNRRENDDRTEFLVFITPRIVNRARSLGQ